MNTLEDVELSLVNDAEALLNTYNFAGDVTQGILVAAALTRIGNALEELNRTGIIIHKERGIKISPEAEGLTRIGEAIDYFTKTFKNKELNNL